MKLEFCPLFSSSSGNATYVASADTRLLVDAGMSARAIDRALSNLSVSLRDIDGVLITHEHTDHIKGIATMARRYGVPVYANENTWSAMEKYAAQIPLSLLRVFETGRDFYIGSIAVQSFSIPHDATDPVGFCLNASGRTACVMTDIGCISKKLLQRAQNADVILIESNHDEDLLKRGPYPAYLKRRILSRVGHLSNVDAGWAVCELTQANVRRFYLGHLSAKNNREDIAWATVHDALSASGIVAGQDIALTVAKRETVSPLCVIE